MAKNIVFVVMPFKSELDNVYFAIQQIGKELDCEVIRVDTLQSTDRITDKILKFLIDADLIVADVTYHNPNVFYEVGYAFAEGKEILLIARGVEELPFDIKDYHVVTYGDETNMRKLSNALNDPIKEALQRSIKQAGLNKPLLEMVKSLSKVECRDNLFYKLLEFHLDEMVKDLALQQNLWVKKWKYIY